MQNAEDRPRLVRFGLFEVDLNTAEIRKSGRKVSLQEQPFQLLVALLERPGEMVTRDKLREKLWPSETVDFDGGLNKAITKIREALGDSAETPRFVETLPRRGYRFIAGVERIEQSEGEQLVSAANLQEAAISGVPAVEFLEAKTGEDLSASSASQPFTREARAKVISRVRQWRAFVVALVSLAAVGLAAHYLRPAPKLTDKDTIVLADFINTTGDSVFDGTLRQGLAIQLRQSPYLRLISDERTRETLHQMSQTAGTPLTPDLARQVCERTTSAAVLDGSIANLGSQYVLGLRARNCQTGEILDEEQVQAARKEDVLSALSQIAKRFRTQVGESLLTVEKHSVPLAEATTTSLEALKAYSAGFKVFISSGDVAALPLFRHAIEIDPEFASAYAAVGRMYGDIGESELSAQATKRAYDLRNRTDDLEKFFITATYDQQVTGNLEKAQRTMELWAQTYPRDPAPHGLLAAMIWPVLGKHEKALEESRKAAELEPENAFGAVVRSIEYQFLNRPGDAESSLWEFPDRKLEIPDLVVQRFDLAFVKGDQAGMDRQVAVAQGKTGAEDLIADHEAFALAYAGRLGEARKKWQHAVALARQAGEGERAALFATGAVLSEAFFGNVAAAKQGTAAVRKLSKGRDVEYGVALALALSGDSAGARDLANDLQRRFPEDTSVQFSFVPVLHAILALNRGEAGKAIDTLDVTVPYELGVPSSYYFGCFGAFFPNYVRGQAYLAARQGAEAAGEFQKILDNRGIVASEPIGALAHLQLGKALELAGKKAEARNAYQDFLTGWKNADSDIPVLKQAWAEYAHLQ